MNDEDELLEPGRRELPRPARIAALVLIVAALAALFAIRLWPESGPKSHQGALGTPPPPPLDTQISEPTGVPLPAWPTAQNGCGGDVDLPIAHTQPPAERTGLRLLVGSNALRVVDFDSGRATPVGDPWQHGHFVASLTGPLPAYATTVTCGVDNHPDLLRIGTDFSTEPLGILTSNQRLLADGDQAWLTVDGKRHRGATLTPIGGGTTIQLPPHVSPDAIEGNTLVGTMHPGQQHSELVLVDLGTGHIRTRIAAAGYPLAVGANQVLWTDDCDPTRDQPCTLHRISLQGTNRRSYRLPRPTPGFGAAISPDGLRVALLLARPDAIGIDDQHPFPPSGIAVLHLDTGHLDVVPKIVIPAKLEPAMGFSADGRWLAVALDAGTKTRVLAWRPGLERAYETAPLRGATYGSPALAALARRGR